MNGKWFRILLTGLMLTALVLAGCSDGSDGAAGTPGADFELPAAEIAGLLACSTCHGSSTAATEWKASKHAMNSPYTINACATSCHNPSGAMYDIEAAFGVSPTGTVVGCEDCHGAGSNHVDLPNSEAVANVAPTTAVCGQCHDGEGDVAHLDHHPFNEQIASRFIAGPHGGENGDNHAREAFCSACHSHEGSLSLFAMGGAENVLDLAAKFTSSSVPSWSKTEEELTLRECATCHDPHTGKLRTDDTVEAVTYDTPPITEDKVVFSAEFNLCTTCHMVDLESTVVDAEDGLFSYQLSSASYSAANMLNAAGTTFDIVEFDIENADLTTTTREIFNTQIFYHDNTPGGGRSFVDTHFAGTVVGRVAAVDETVAANAIADVTVTGYNVNAAAVDACTTCHDPHSANKVQGEDGVAQAQSFAEGVGMFHANYLGSALGRNCTPCHDGGESFVTWLRGGSEPEAGDSDTRTIACRTCHQLEQLEDSVDEEGNPITVLGDPTAVRAFPEDHEFAFGNGAIADVADLGVNQICFECHKGRSGVKEGAFDAATTRAYDVSYLHYAPAFATLFGNESGMVPTYAGKTYAGKFVHGGGAAGQDSAEFGCVDCHNVHDTDGNNVIQNKMVTSADCLGCHQSGAFVDANLLEDRTVAFGERLRDTIIATYNTRFDPDIDQDAFHDIQAGRNAASEIGANDLAVATAIYRVFNYDDGSPHGTEHGHGGSWAHNSRFARQVQYDAIESIGGDLTGLTRP